MSQCSECCADCMPRFSAVWELLELGRLGVRIGFVGKSDVFGFVHFLILAAQ